MQVMQGIVDGHLFAAGASDARASPAPISSTIIQKLPISTCIHRLLDRSSNCNTSVVA